ncbi:unnamed protein product [Adineta steineri]|uniref:Importin-9 n=1 Tax=Adineta steineri TaxID=433720 RepID=A0A814MXE0_9BILA|nr:unnamed protein product [Adineta steineri]
MESSADLRSMIEQTLTMIITPDQQLIEKGQTQLQALELLDTYTLALTEISIDNTRDISIRQLAGVLLRKYVNKHWTRDIENFVEPEVTEQVKSQIRRILPHGLNEPNHRLRVGLACVISAVAEWDCPESWPELLPFLIESLKTTNKSLIHGSIRVLTEIVRDLDDRQLPFVLPLLLPEMYRLMVSNEFSLRIRTRAIGIFTLLVSLVHDINERDRILSVGYILPYLPPYCEAFKRFLIAPDSSLMSDTGCRIETIRALTLLFKSFPKLMQQDAANLLQSVWTCLTSNTENYVATVVYKHGEMDASVDSDGETLSFECLIYSLFEFVQVLMDLSTYKNSVKTSMEELCYYLILYSSRSIDCLDGSDEAESRSLNKVMHPDCSHISTFRCQERIGRYPWSFPCGDGEYLTDTYLPADEKRCSNGRDIELTRIMLNSMDHITNINCQKAFYCALHLNRTFGLDQFNGLVILKPPPSIADVWNNDCEPLAQHCSSEWLIIPAYPILFGFFQFLYFTNRSVDQFKENIIPDLVCFNEQSCPMLLTKIDSIQIINGLTCCHPSNLTEFTEAKDFNDLVASFGFYYHQCLKMSNENSCINSSYFYCNESKKCIPNYRVGDGASDCIWREDESFNTCQWNDSNRFKCESDSNKCLSSVALGNGLADCPSTEDELFSYTQNLIILTPFPELCNHYNNRKIYPLELTETDETNCDWWPCNNPYTKCDKYWNCPNGADELNCPNTKCSFNELVCYKEHFESSYCIPLVHMYEKYLDPCDDTDLLREFYFYNETTNINDDYFSWNDSKCITLDKLCRINHDLQTESTEEEELCLYQYGGLMWIKPVVIFQNKEYLCEFELRTGNDDFERFFKSTGLGNYPEISTNRSVSFMSRIHKNEIIMPHIDSELSSFCHRGIAVLNGMDETKKCFCPPNYFGSRCQWQNQRISLSLQLIYHSMTSINAIFQVIIILVDEHNGSTSNHEQITYIPTLDCDTKFNIYLLYPDRPKNLLNNYSIRIDLYEKTKLDYWASWYLSIPFRFLPVNRIAAKLLIPEIPEIQSCSLPCGEHGKCKRYINEKFLFFCYCDQGYSGTRCNITHKCDCANGSLCVDSSICICPLYKFGTYCYLKHSVCQTSNNLCQNNGICIPTDDRISSTGFTCFCPESYSGERCQNKNNRIDIHLDDKIISTTSLLLHFITGFNDAEHERISILKKISFYQKILTIYVSQPFNILLVEIPNQYYYLVVLRQVYIPSENISVEIQSKQRCSSIDELDNNTFAQYGYFNRTKYYPLLCRQDLNLMCFYDQDLMCICDTNRFSNCFLFDKNMNNDYQGYNYCENGGQGFQNNNTCPTKFTCICPECFYGARCQFSTEGIIFSLDAILGYHIQPHVSLNQQPLIIKLNIVISTTLFLLGLFNGVLSFLLFRKKKLRQVGTGYYLLFSSLTSIFNIILLIIKFWLLTLSQMSLITNRSFLYFNCITIDVSFKILLASNEWLNACVAIERMVSATKGTSFNKKKSRKISKWVIISVFILTILTHIHDPLHRKLVDDMDTDEQRIWCFVKYSDSVNIYNSFIALFHFLITFLINIVCALWIIKSLAYNRRNVHRDQTLRQHLNYQIQQHRHLLIAPCLLVLVNIPRLIISVSSGCMKSAREPWLYLTGYYLSFIPSMLTFIIFVLPSKTYKTEFNATIEETKRRCGIHS